MSRVIPRKALQRKRRGGDFRCRKCFTARVPPYLARQACADFRRRFEARKSSAGAKALGGVRAGNPTEQSLQSARDGIATVAASLRRSDPPPPP